MHTPWEHFQLELKSGNIIELITRNQGIIKIFVYSCVEKYVGEGSSIAVVAGSRAFLVRKVGDRCIVQMPSKQELSLKQECMATVGRVSNEEHSSHHIGSAQRLRWLGFRPRSGLWHRKDGRYVSFSFFLINQD